LLQGRNFSYFDTQITRLGVNWEQLPINRPVCPVMNHNRDGAMQHRITKGEVNYWPNRKNVGKPVPVHEGGYHEYAQKVEGMKQRIRGAKFQEHYNQAQLFYNSMAPHEQAHIIAAISFELSHCDDPITYKTYTQILNNIDFNLAKTVAINVGGVIPTAAGKVNKGQKSATLSQLYYAPKTPTIKSRRVAIMLADGFDMAEMQTVRAAFASAGAVNFIIGPRRGKVYSAGEVIGEGEGVMADHHYEGQRSTMFDALFIPSGAEHAKTLAGNGRVIHWVREAFGHCKAIGAIGDGVTFLRDAVALPGIDLFASTNSETVVSSYGVVTAGSYGIAAAAKDALTIASGPKGFASNFAYEISKHRCYEREIDGLVTRVAY